MHATSQEPPASTPVASIEEPTVSESPPAGRRPKRKAARYVVLLLLILALLVGWVLPKVHFRSLVSQLNASDPKIRLKAVKELGSLRNPNAVRPLTRQLLRETDRNIAEMIAYGLAKIKDPRGRSAIKDAIAKSPDDSFAARMYQHLAKLSADRERAFLRSQLHGNTPWKTIGAAAGLLEANDAAGGPVLLDFMENGKNDQKLFAAQALLQYVVPMMDMIGQRPEDLQPNPTHPLPPDQVAVVKNWWARSPTDQLLNDYVIWHRRPNPKWRKIKKLLHARDRVARFFGAERKHDG